MALQRCVNAHLFDPTKHTSCPHCGVPSAIKKEIKHFLTPDAPPASQSGSAATSPTPYVCEAGLTKGIYQGELGIDPVCGWLVCVEGSERGRDYRIRAQNNSIGRSETNQICIEGDNQISRENHATISYDPRTNQYALLPGSSRGIVYHNGAPVYTPSKLNAFDEIRLGATTLLFVPLCGESGAPGFKWA